MAIGNSEMFRRKRLYRRSFNVSDNDTQWNVCHVIGKKREHLPIHVFFVCTPVMDEKEDKRRNFGKKYIGMEIKQNETKKR